MFLPIEICLKIFKDLEYIESRVNRFNIRMFVRCQYLSETLIEKYAKHLSKTEWRIISASHPLSMDFIEKYQDYVYWDSIASSQKLNLDFILKFLHKFYWKNLLCCQKIPIEILTTYNIEHDTLNHFIEYNVYRRLRTKYRRLLGIL